MLFVCRFWGGRESLRDDVLLGGADIPVVYDDGAFKVWSQAVLRPPVFISTNWVCVGSVRLDDRCDVIAELDWKHRGATDLEIVAALLERDGTSRLTALNGDFGLVAWHRAQRRLCASSDPLGVKRLTYRTEGDTLYVADGVQVLSRGSGYCLSYMADFLLHGLDTSDRTVFEAVKPLPPGGILRSSNGVHRVTRYWTPRSFIEQGFDVKPADAAETFHELFVRAVTCRLDDGKRAWVELSGGVDSSSITAVAMASAESAGTDALAGTVTHIDSLGNGDESDFVRALIDRYPIENHAIFDCPAWDGDTRNLPYFDQPSVGLPYWERERALVSYVVGRGGQILLNGVGSDSYLVGSSYFIADILARGSLLTAFQSAMAYAIVRRKSTWSYFYRVGLKPLLMTLRSRVGRPVWSRSDMPSWLRRSFITEHEVIARTTTARRGRATWRGHYLHELEWEMETLCRSWVGSSELLGDSLDRRFPFLDRRLVEFALRLPPSAITTPEYTKYVLRQAVADVLPDRIRLRTGKGSVGARFKQAFDSAAANFEALTRQSRLEALGVISGSRLRHAIRQCRAGLMRNAWPVIQTLCLEMWLRQHDANRSEHGDVSATSTQLLRV